MIELSFAKLGSAMVSPKQRDTNEKPVGIIPSFGVDGEHVILPLT